MKHIKRGRGPSAMGAMGSLFAAVFGVIWTIAAVSMGAPWFFALFGVLFVALFGVIIISVFFVIVRMHIQRWTIAIATE